MSIMRVGGPKKLDDDDDDDQDCITFKDLVSTKLALSENERYKFSTIK